MATQREREHELGKEWANHHYAMPGSPEPVRYGNTVHDDACALRWKCLTGSFPSWDETANVVGEHERWGR